MRWALMAAVLACGCGKPAGDGGNTQEPAKAAAWEGPPVESDALLKAYQTDSAAAFQKYGGRVIRVRLTATQVRAIGEKIAAIDHQFTPPDSYPHVEARVPAGDVKHVTTGRPVVVEGKVVSSGDRAVELEGVVVP